MKILLIGPYPPPHGGVSVHVLEALRQLQRAGILCRVLNTDVRAPLSSAYLRARHWPDLVLIAWRHARRGWTLHVHTNGHNFKSWLVAVLCGLAGQSARGCLLTLHSGMAPRYLSCASVWRRMLAAFACSLYTRVICVSSEIQKTLFSLGVPASATEVLPAYLTTGPRQAIQNTRLRRWAEHHRPLLSTALFFRPEYGFDVLVAALARLRRSYPQLGCVAMGSGEQRAEAEARICGERLENSILLAGDVDHDTCLEVMSISDVFVRPTFDDGDSIAVREALSLGMPVVASNASNRPEGVILFQTNDVEDLHAKLEAALLVPRRAVTPAAGEVGRLLDVYRRTAASEEMRAAV
jgi:glycogen synthase